jgi:hypothetical protein
MCIPLSNETAMVHFETHTRLDEPSAPLNTGGWTFQEAFPSPRILCCDAD